MTWHQAVWGYGMALGLLWLGGKFWFAPGSRGPRRLFSRIYGTLFATLGVMLAFAQLFLEGPAQQLAELSDAATLRGEPAPYSDDDKRFAAIWAAFWILFLLVFLALTMTLFVDLTRREPRSRPRASLFFPRSKGSS